MSLAAAGAFIEQNPHASANLHPEDLSAFAEHHAGGLFVLGSPAFTPGFYVKMHDTWGPGTPDEPGNIVVHVYDPNGDPEDDSDTVVHFTNARHAFTYFLEVAE